MVNNLKKVYLYYDVLFSGKKTAICLSACGHTNTQVFLLLLSERYKISPQILKYHS